MINNLFHRPPRGIAVLVGAVLATLSLSSSAGETELKAKMLSALLAGGLYGYEVTYLDLAVLNSGQTQSYGGTFFEGTPYLHVAAGERSDMDVDVYVFDAAHHKICEDADLDDVAVCRHTPAWTGHFESVVKMYTGKGVYGYMVLAKPY